jgi:hypothetical protein
MKKIVKEKLTEKTNSISAYNVWVIMSYGSTDVNEIFLDKIDAEKIAKQRNEDYYNYYRERHKNMSDKEFEEYFNSQHIKRSKDEVKSLSDAIELIKDDIRADERMDDE